VTERFCAEDKRGILGQIDIVKDSGRPNSLTAGTRTNAGSAGAPLRREALRRD
jgi:hypothetical protein